jgi:hypothetical protein
MSKRFENIKKKKISLYSVWEHCIAYILNAKLNHHPQLKNRKEEKREERNTPSYYKAA